MEISGKTGLTALIGSPVSHSISPKIQNLSFEALGIDCVYLALDIKEEDLGKAVEGLRSIGIWGFNVTLPYKEKVVEWMDDLTDAARLIGACNTVIVKDGRMIGHTTDGAGFMRSVSDLGCDVIGKKISILGAGGAAKSIIAQAAIDGVSAIDIFQRKPSPRFSETVALAEKIQTSTGCRIRVCEFADSAQMRQSFSESVLLINATNLGMAPHEDTCPLDDASLLRPELYVCDIIYNPRTTRLLKMAQDAGCRTANGLGMLLFTGAASFQCWTGKEMPVDLIRDRIFSS
ncbi:MAG: shikimate dehydrogenase [Lachnospiraceae bacterium]|nr:shikimate dehydrogenase [Lachnospiraceae bacterium]